MLTEGCVGGTEYDGDNPAGDWTPARARKYNTGVVLLRPDAERFRELVGALGGGAAGAGAYTCKDGFQTLWNRVLAKRVVCLHHSFNCIEHAGAAAFGGRCLLPNAARPHVVHFAGASKPWLDAPRRACQSVGCLAWQSFFSPRNRSPFFFKHRVCSNPLCRRLRRRRCARRCHLGAHRRAAQLEEHADDVAALGLGGWVL